MSAGQAALLLVRISKARGFVPVRLVTGNDVEAMRELLSRRLAKPARRKGDVGFELTQKGRDKAKVFALQAKQAYREVRY